jgi:hypothetical protein
MVNCNGKRFLADCLDLIAENASCPHEIILAAVPVSRGKTVDRWEALDKKAARAISGLRCGQYAPAHLPYSGDLVKLIEGKSCKIVTIIRDPRDVYISAAMYLAHMDTGHICQHQ